MFWLRFSGMRLAHLLILRVLLAPETDLRCSDLGSAAEEAGSAVGGGGVDVPSPDRAWEMTATVLAKKCCATVEISSECRVAQAR